MQPNEVTESSNTEEDARTVVEQFGKEARKASVTLAKSITKTRNTALLLAAQEIRSNLSSILEANKTDLSLAQLRGLSKAKLDRLLLDHMRLENIAASLESIAALPDPIGRIIDEWTQPNGLRISRVRVPLGVIGIIYESRPNVTADAGALSLKSGNAVILRGGSESNNSSRAIYECLRTGIIEAGLPAATVQLIPTTDRSAVSELLGLRDYLDVIVPRGGRSLIKLVLEESQIPVIAHLDGICHVYLHNEAEIEMARNIVLNSKMRRTGICGAAETLLVDENFAKKYLTIIVGDLVEAGCEVRGDAMAQSLDPRVKRASDLDWSTEYLDAILSICIVKRLEDAIQHIGTYGSQHTESIVTSNKNVADQFLSEVDSAILLHNASTQFADGGEFGMGAEIGISTGRLHARGPVGLEQLTTYKYVVHGSGQIRP